MNILETILAHKKQEVATRQKVTPQEQLVAMPWYRAERRSLIEALRGKPLAVIAEIKKASPSKNLIREDFDPVAIAGEYVENGASALSVVTDEKFFQGDLASIAQIRHFVTVPILRKDFILDSYQLHESKAYAADAVLLIAAAVEPARLHELHLEAEELGLECLVEVHNEKEIESLDLTKIDLVGINNRDLTTFETDLGVSIRLKKFLAEDKVVVSESGIRSYEDINTLVKHGIHAVLIGESLIRAHSPGEALRELLRKSSGSSGVLD